jgi:hypothetical protein
MQIKSKKIIGFNGRINNSVIYHYDINDWKVKEEILDGSGNLIEMIVNSYNSEGLIEKTEYFNKKGMKFYSVFQYDNNKNCIQEIGYNDKDEIQVIYNFEFDTKNRKTKSQELTSENEIWEWQETLYPDDSRIIYISKDADGNIDLKNIEYLDKGRHELYNGDGSLRSTITKTYDSEGRVINSLTKNSDNQTVDESKYSYKNNVEIWEYFSLGRFVKSEERQYNENNNLIYYIRKDSDGRCLEWSRTEYDEYGNQTLIEGGNEFEKITYRTKIEIEY